MKVYIDYQNQDTGVAKSMRNSVITSLGFIGDEEVVPFLERILNGRHVDWMNSVIACSLYLLTGEKYEFNWQGNKQKFVETKEIRYARKVILDTRWRKRTFEDMIIIDKVLRPVRYKNSDERKSGIF